MYCETDKTFELIKREFVNNGSSTEFIEKAYNYAKVAHKGQLRKDGQPYISHPVAVALILAKQGFNEDVVSGALLHDVVEDCGCTIEDLRKEFNSNVAQLVDCVSAIDKEKYVFDKDDLYEDEEFKKISIEEQSFRKLIAIGKNNPLGFCIKFADRLHNLRTIETFDYSKQLEKVKETERWIIPIARILNAEYFYRSLKNECFIIKNRYTGKEFFDQYENYHKINSRYIEDLQLKLKEVFSSSSIKTIKIKDVRPYKVFEDLNSLLKNINISKVSQGTILKVTNYNIYLLYDHSDYKTVISEVLNILNSYMANELKVIDAKMGNFTNKPFYQLEDKFKTKFNLYVMSHSDYILLRNGTLIGQDIKALIDEDDIDDLIKVKTRSGEIKYIPKSSTVLDFAFRISSDLGFGFKYAIVNNSKTKCPPFTKVFAGDTIEIVVEKDANNEIINRAELKWLAYVNTDYAKKNLIKYFERKIGN